MPKYTSGRTKRFGQRDLTADRYEFLGLEQAEPDLGDPTVGVGSTGSNPKPVGQTYVLTAVAGYEGKRYWTPINTEGVEIDVVGEDGEQGTQGVQGTQGTGTQGSQGTQGARGGAASWIRKTSNHTASDGEQIIADTTNGAFTITLPSSPQQGYSIEIADGGDWRTTNLTIDANGSNIEGSTDDELIVDIGQTILSLVYEDSTDGWQVYSSLGPQGIQGTSNQGSQGLQGLSNQGTQGVQGSGTQGAQGLQGLQGVQGLQGNQGNQGTQGSGTQGNQGLQGLSNQGSQGNQGLQGIQGTGVQGAQGLQGRGGQGLQGTQGAISSQGNQGAQGTGTQGAQGLQGTQGGGRQGTQGNQGLQGNVGPKGLSGLMSFGIIDPRETDDMTLVNVTETTVLNVSNMPNATWLPSSSPIFVFDQGSANADRYVRINGHVYLHTVSRLYFTVSKGGGSGWGESPSLNCNLFLQYKQDGGSWTTMKRIQPTDISDNGVWEIVQVVVPSGAKILGGVKLQIIQENHNGPTYDTWACSVVLPEVSGIQGSQGTQGAQGRQGAQGAQGYQGHQGTQGRQGAQGKANQGAQGSPGNYQGTQGNQGLQGAQGVQGYQGFQGIQGHQASTIVDPESIFEIMLFN